MILNNDLVNKYYDISIYMCIRFYKMYETRLNSYRISFCKGDSMQENGRVIFQDSYARSFYLFSVMMPSALKTSAHLQKNMIIKLPSFCSMRQEWFGKVAMKTLQNPEGQAAFIVSDLFQSGV